MHHSEQREKKFYQKNFFAQFWCYFHLRWQSEMLIQFSKEPKLYCLLSQNCSLQEVALMKKIDIYRIRVKKQARVHFLKIQAHIFNWKNTFNICQAKTNVTAGL